LRRKNMISIKCEVGNEPIRVLKSHDMRMIEYACQKRTRTERERDVM
jgi:hypothetical protein